MRSGFSVMSERRLMSWSSENLNPSLLSFFASILIEFKGFMIIAFYLNRLCRWCQEILEKYYLSKRRMSGEGGDFFKIALQGRFLPRGNTIGQLIIPLQ